MTVKIFAGNDMPAVRVCTILASKVVEAGYLQGSTKTLNDGQSSYM